MYKNSRVNNSNQLLSVTGAWSYKIKTTFATNSLISGGKNRIIELRKMVNPMFILFI